MRQLAATCRRKDEIMNLTMFGRIPGTIEQALRHGAGNGRTMAELTDLFHCSDREIRLQVHRERVDGAVILAGDSGFYLPSEDPETALQEIRAFENRMKAKARNTLKATISATTARKQLETSMN